MHVVEIKTGRLKLRPWRDSDQVPFAELNGDAEVMKYYPGILSKQESNQLINRFQSLISDRGWGFWAIEHLESLEFLGFVGLHQPDIAYSFNPCVEIGWRLKRDAWGFGFATEGAMASLDFAFKVLDLSEILSFTSVHNKRSEAVMRRIGMVNTGENFAHPNLPLDSHLSEHVLYRISKHSFLEGSCNDRCPSFGKI